MKERKTDPIANSLNLEPLPQRQVEIIDPDHVSDDYEFARGNIISVINKGQEALDDIASIAQQSESARAYEVTTALIKTLVEANKDLLDLAKKKKDLRDPKEIDDSNRTVNNNLFVGSTSELVEMLQNMKNGDN